MNESMPCAWCNTAVKITFRRRIYLDELEKKGSTKTPQVFCDNVCNNKKNNAEERAYRMAKRGMCGEVK